ncbi:MAG: hypothetical protein Ct9H300mP1_36930 [Planctomycetaceae bacterium]|nr:MAG: hypothetical protein Ct9H300mP1_36930 [Planctomycetaceae bacterium]
MFRSLADVGVNLHMISTSEIKISVFVDRDRCEEAVAAVHAGFWGFMKNKPKGPGVGVELPPEDRQAVLSEREELEQDVVDRLASMEDIVVSDVQLDDEQARITVRDIPDVPGIVAAVFSAVAEGGILVDMIVQNESRGRGESERRASLTFTVPRRDLDSALLLVREVVDQWPGATIGFERDIAMLTVVGIGLRSHTGVGGTDVRCAGGGPGINIQMINTSEIRVSVVVGLADGPGRAPRAWRRRSTFSPPPRATGGRVVFAAEELAVDPDEIVVTDWRGFDFHPAADAEDPVTATGFSD